MMCGTLRLILIILSLATLGACSAWAGYPCSVLILDSNIDPSAFFLKRGETVKIVDAQGLSYKAHFLGRVTDYEGRSESLAFVDLQSMGLHYISLDAAKVILPNQTEVDPNKSEIIIKTAEQEVGNCAAHAVFNCLQMISQLSSTHPAAALIKKNPKPGQLLKKLDKMFYPHGHDAIEDVYSPDVYDKVEKQVKAITRVFKNNKIKFQKTENPETILQALEANKVVVYAYGGGETQYFMHTYVHHDSEFSPDVSVVETTAMMPSSFFSEGLGGHMVYLTHVLDEPGFSKRIVVIDSNLGGLVLWPAQELKYKPHRDTPYIATAWIIEL